MPAVILGTIMIVQIVELSCDCCGKDYDTQECSAKDLRSAAKDRGWINRGAKDFCRSCVESGEYKNADNHVIK